MTKTTEHRERLRRIVEKIDQLDAENVARFERLVDRLAAITAKESAGPAERKTR